MSDERDSEQPTPTGEPGKPKPPAHLADAAKVERTLLPHHREQLYKSGLTDESITAGGFYSITTRPEISAILGWEWRLAGAALAIPYRAPGSDAAVLTRLRPDKPRETKKRDKETGEERVKEHKYEQPKGRESRPYYPARTLAEGRLQDPTCPLVFVEGEKKAALIDQLGRYAVVGSSGVWNFHDPLVRQAEDAYRLRATIREVIAWAPTREAFVCFDSDQVTNEQVARAGGVLGGMLADAGIDPARIRNVEIPPGEKGKAGIDDYAVSAGEDAARRLFEIAPTATILRGDDVRVALRTCPALRDAPIDLGLAVPTKYEIAKDGAIWTSDAEKPARVERAPILVSRIVSDLASGAQQLELVFKRAGSWATALVPRRDVVVSRHLVETLAPLGAPVDSNTAARVVEWLRDFETYNERKLPHTRSVGRSGWHDVDAQRVFVVGADVVTKPGEGAPDLLVQKHGDRGRIARGLVCAGSFDEHLELLKRAWSASPQLATMIAAGFAAPLLKLLAAESFGVHAMGPSSRGKSTALRLSAGIYGDPRNEDWAATWNSTQVGHERRASLFCDLPIYCDEAGVVEPHEREKAAYMLINGVGRTRGARDGGTRDVEYWRTVLISTGERRLVDHTAGTGAQTRVLQIDVDGIGELDAAGVDALRAASEQQFGHVGRRWLAELASVGAEDVEELRARHREITERLRVAITSTVEARRAKHWALLVLVEDLLSLNFDGLGREDGATIAEFVASKADDGGIGEAIRSEAERALEAALDVVASDRAATPRCVRVTVGGQAGCLVTKASEHGRAAVKAWVTPEGGVLFVPTALREILAVHGIDDRVAVLEWIKRGWYDGEPDHGRITTRCRVDGEIKRVIPLTPKSAGMDRSVCPVDGPGVTGDWSQAKYGY